MNTPSFYCENCGKKVSQGKDTCPGCGQEFSLVKCPSCGFSGDASLFKVECPQCGYSGIRNDNIPKKNVKQLPVWLYSVLIGIMVVIIFGLIRIYFLL